MWHGLAAIDGKYPDRSGTSDGLAYLMGLITGLGCHTVKLELSTATTTKYAQNTWGSPTSLKTLAQQTPLANVFATAGLTRFQINTFSLAVGTDNPWAGKWTKAVGDTIETEFYDLCVHLITTYSKEFILQSWEGDWQLLNSFNPSAGIPLTRLGAYRDYQRRRQRALRKAITDNPGAPGTLRYAIECNRVLDDYGIRLHTHVLGNVKPDVISLSSYEAIEGWLNISTQAALEADITTKLTNEINRVKAASPTSAVVIGEYGFPRLVPYFPLATIDVPLLHARVIAVATALGVEGEIPWQATDNEEQSPGVPRGFGFWDRNGSSTTVGALTDVGVYYRDHVF